MGPVLAASWGLILEGRRPPQWELMLRKRSKSQGRTLRVRLRGGALRSAPPLSCNLRQAPGPVAAQAARASALKAERLRPLWQRVRTLRIILKSPPKKSPPPPPPPHFFFSRLPLE